MDIDRDMVAFIQFRVDDKETKVTIGYFFLDMHPRDGKYGHAAIFDLQPSCLGEDGKRQANIYAKLKSLHQNN